MRGKRRQGPAPRKRTGSRSDAANLLKLAATAPSSELPGITFLAGWGEGVRDVLAANTGMSFAATPHSPVGEFPKLTRRSSLIHSLSDIYSAEKQMTKSLPKMARASTNPGLRSAFETHLEETQRQIERIDQVVEASGIKLKRIKCVAMEGLIEEGQEQIDEIEKGPVLDTALIAAAQKVEHYEIAAYGSLIALTKQLGETTAAKLLAETLKEEKATDEKLSLLAEEKQAAEALGK
jgi:ferritin-like metal-binding protein YciE